MLACRTANRRSPLFNLEQQPGAAGDGRRIGEARDKPTVRQKPSPVTPGPQAQRSKRDL